MTFMSSRSFALQKRKAESPFLNKRYSRRHQTSGNGSSGRGWIKCFELDLIFRMPLKHAQNILCRPFRATAKVYWRRDSAETVGGVRYCHVLRQKVADSSALPRLFQAIGHLPASDAQCARGMGQVALCTRQG